MSVNAKGKSKAPSAPQAKVTAAGLTLGYFVFCFAYILLSSHLVSQLADSVPILARYEQAKGLAFIVISGLFFYEFAYRVLQRAEAKGREVLEHQYALADADRRAMAGTLASSVAHDINNILTVAGADVEELASRTDGDSARDETTDQLAHAIRDIGGLARRLMQLGRERLGAEDEDVHLLDVVRQAADFAGIHRAMHSCVVKVEGDETVKLRANSARISNLVLNLVLNAAEATCGRGVIHLVVRRDPGEGAVLECHDNGPGFAPALREKIFQPFVTTKPSGTGLGLFSVKATAEEYGGRVEYDVSPLGGALFRVIMAGPSNVARASLGLT